MPDTLRQFQATMRKLRLERGWSYTDMGNRIDCARQNVFELETSDRVPSIEREAKVAEAFGLTRAEFLSVTQGLDSTPEGD